MRKRVCVSKWIRRTHLLLALFLTPWVLMYAISTLAMHHQKFLTGEDHRVDPGYTFVREESYPRVFSADMDQASVARLILQDLELEGGHQVRNNLQRDGTLVINRDRPIGSLRITYDADEASIRVEKQRFAMVYFLEMLHRRRGFDQPYWMNDAWGLIVDGFILAVLLWAASGLWMWWEMVRTRKPGAWCLGAGVGLFIFFLLTL